MPGMLSPGGRLRGARVGSGRAPLRAPSGAAVFFALCDAMGEFQGSAPAEDA